MTEHDDLKLVFTGSVLDAKYLKSVLEENGIGALVRDTLDESLSAGWVSGSQEDSGLVFVSEEHFEKAKKIADEYRKSLGQDQ